MSRSRSRPPSPSSVLSLLLASILLNTIASFLTNSNTLRRNYCHHTTTTTTNSYDYYSSNYHMKRKQFIIQRTTTKEEEETEVLLQPLNDDNNTIVNNNVTTKTSTTIDSINNNNNETKKIEGMGGMTGFSYDVNRVKFNLVQQAQKEYKQELLNLLGSVCDVYDDTIHNNKYEGNDDEDDDTATIEELLEDKLAVLFMVNPVTTTTDSNLLDGSWHLVYEADNAKRVLNMRSSSSVSTPTPDNNDIVNYRNNIKFPNNNNQAPWVLSKGRLETPFKSIIREVHLEDLQDDEHPYVVDHKSYLNGIFKIKTHYDVIKLTRTSLHLLIKSKTLSFWKHDRFWKDVLNYDDESNANPITMQQILYVDSDLCMSTNQREFNGPLFLYSKSPSWTNDQQVKARKLRLLRSIPTWLFYTAKKPFQYFLPNKFKSIHHLSNPEVEHEQQQYKKEQLTIQYLLNNNNNKTTATTAFKIGEIDPLNQNETYQQAWSIDEDPFYHLDNHNERLNALKNISLYDIHKAGNNYKSINDERKNEWYTLTKKFKKPPNKN